MNKKFVITILLAVFGMMNGIAQEYLTGFNGGIPDEKPLELRDEVVATLPFFDDFTKPGIYPDATKWMPGNVIANSNFPYMPVNHRAATLDVIDRNGKVYSRGSSNPFIADTLMSVKIRLDILGEDTLGPDDNLYFSFYYQAGGYGDKPETDDSLVLQFGYGYDEVVFDSVLNNYVTMRKTAWKQQWPLRDSIHNDSVIFDGDFHKVMIPIVDSCFFVEDFRVMFFNYGTLPTTMYPNDRSNMDQWNIDMVYLDKDRDIEDDTYPLVGLTGTAPTFLKRYQSMPYKHFKDNPINENQNVYDIFMTNLDVNAHQVRYTCKVEDNNSGWNYSYSKDTVVEQYSDKGVIQNRVMMSDFIYPYNLPTDTTSFTISQYIQVIDEHSDEVRGDTVIRNQVFGNYFAYDDGTPEKGYGLVPGDTYMAVQFKASHPDTIQGVQMLFNRTFNDANYNFFDIVVWNDNNGKPGNEIYTLQNQRPIWNDSVIYAFSEYTFDKIVKVNSTFYVGLRQRYSKSINIGFDASIDNHQYNFYETGEGWKNSSFPGSIMIRPIMGGNANLVINPDNQDDNNIGLYPNPAHDVVRIDGINDLVYKEIAIYDLAGRLVKRYPYANELDINDLRDGVYLLRAVREDGSFKTTKLMICK